MWHGGRFTVVLDPNTLGMTGGQTGGFLGGLNRFLGGGGARGGGVNCGACLNSLSNPDEHFGCTELGVRNC